jgi:hypothetical protein
MPFNLSGSLGTTPMRLGQKMDFPLSRSIDIQFFHDTSIPEWNALLGVRRYGTQATSPPRSFAVLSED